MILTESWSVSTCTPGQSAESSDTGRIHREQMQSWDCPILIDRRQHTRHISVVWREMSGFLSKWEREIFIVLS